MGGHLRVVVVAVLVTTMAIPASTGAQDSALRSSGEETRATDPGRVEPGLLEDLREDRNHLVVQFEETVPHELEAQVPGLTVPYEFQSLPAVYAVGPASAVRTLVQLEEVTYVERADKPIEFDLDSATLASMAREVWDPSADNPLVDKNPAPIRANGELVDGSGVGIAIVDSGVDPTHPDFLAQDKLVRSFVAGPSGVVEAPYFSPQDPHGTAVAGVAAGDGEASGGEMAGAAPGASLYSFAVQHGFFQQGAIEGEPITLYPAIAMDWIAEHGDEQAPEIRVVNNAWHCRLAQCRATMQSQAIHAQLARELVEEGIVVTWAYGNTLFTWNPEATLPVQGVLGVTSTTDFDQGTREGCKSNHASEGHPLDPTTWPDVAAPGSQITTTAPLSTTTQTRTPLSAYSTFSGTSFAAAHVAGTAALLLDANGDLTPAEVEWLIEDSATRVSETCNLPYNRGDPTHPTSEANHEIGHGLLDTHAAVENATGFAGIPATDETALEPRDEFLEPDDRDDLDTVDVEDRLYLDGSESFSGERPTDPKARSAEFEPNEAAVFVSEPFDQATSVTGVDASVWMRVDTEPITQYSFLAGVDVLMKVQRVGPGDVLKDEALISGTREFSVASEILERPFVQTFTQPLAFEAGDRLRVEIEVSENGAAGPETALSGWELFWGSAEHPAHVGIGERAPDATGTYRDCRGLAPWACGWIDADHPSAMLDLDGGQYELRWEGPGGTGAQFSYQGIPVDQCTVPEDQAWGRCELRTHSAITGALGATSCSLLEPKAPNPGHGRCWILRDR